MSKVVHGPWRRVYFCKTCDHANIKYNSGVCERCGSEEVLEAVGRRVADRHTTLWVFIYDTNVHYELKDD